MYIITPLRCNLCLFFHFLVGFVFLKGGADIIACVKKDLRSSEFRVAAYSTSYYHDTPTEKESYSNLTQYKEEDGFVYCHIQIPFKQRTGPDGRYFDLSNDWYQLYAWGNIDAGMVSEL